MGAVPVPKHLYSRLLYPNPVCVLTTLGADGTRNAMTLSWLSCVDNRGCFVFSMNARRFSASLLRETGSFGIGGCHGPQGGVDKLSALEVPVCAPGWEGPPQDGVPSALMGAVAHLECTARLAEVRELEGHLLVVADVRRALVRPSHWDGKRFRPVAPTAQPCLAFFGSASFGYAATDEQLRGPPQAGEGGGAAPLGHEG